jgi:hypothetical protein
MPGGHSNQQTIFLRDYIGEQQAEILRGLQNNTNAIRDLKKQIDTVTAETVEEIIAQADKIALTFNQTFRKHQSGIPRDLILFYRLGFNEGNSCVKVTETKILLSLDNIQHSYSEQKADGSCALVERVNPKAFCAHGSDAEVTLCAEVKFDDSSNCFTLCDINNTNAIASHVRRSPTLRLGDLEPRVIKHLNTMTFDDVDFLWQFQESPFIDGRRLISPIEQMGSESLPPLYVTAACFSEHGTLRDFLKKPPADFNETQAYNLCWSLAKGLSELHSKKIHHGDLSCSNILIKKTKQGNYYCEIGDLACIDAICLATDGYEDPLLHAMTLDTKYISRMRDSLKKILLTKLFSAENEQDLLQDDKTTDELLKATVLLDKLERTEIQEIIETLGLEDSLKLTDIQPTAKASDLWQAIVYLLNKANEDLEDLTCRLKQTGKHLCADYPKIIEIQQSEDYDTILPFKTIGVTWRDTWSFGIILARIFDRLSSADSDWDYRAITTNSILEGRMGALTQAQQSLIAPVLKIMHKQRMSMQQFVVFFEKTVTDIPLLREFKRSQVDTLVTKTKALLFSPDINEAASSVDSTTVIPVAGVNLA